MIVGSSVEQLQLRQKRPHLKSESKSHPDGDRKRHRLEGHFDSQAEDDTSKHSAIQFETLSNLIHEIKEAKVQLSRFVVDFTEKQELVGELVKNLQGPCRICSHAGTQHMQNDDSEGSSTFNDEGSQLPL